MAETAVFEEWAIVEILGRRRYAGFVREVTIAGAGFIRVDIPAAGSAAGAKEWKASPIFSPASIYCITPCTEKTAREVAAIGDAAPVQRWELPSPNPEVKACLNCGSPESECVCGPERE